MRVLAALATCVALVAPLPANALTFNYTGQDFSGISDFVTPTVAATAVFTQVDAKTVSLKLSLGTGLAGDAYLDTAWFNYSGTLTGLTAVYGGTGIAPGSILIGANAHSADGGGQYDIEIQLPNKAADRLKEGGFTTITFSSTTSLDASLFESLSGLPAGNGQHLSALHIAGLTIGTGSGFYAGLVPPPGGGGDVPLPAALPLFATILAGGGLVAWRRKKKTAKVVA